ncbi:ECF transporter S component [Dictyobacter arantiisoli]|uniref:ECF transporter S component n=1 Tax=Dictyobacter arantiisoli TaxID=2014874 RepID=A0A5A5TDX2_9CHLR|nr:ECF transporter S component [Dictyobacter arantiisoli]GCF09740.1 hypothetical protein KDI_33040 [Dictyobacter arantiisoli]
MATVEKERSSRQLATIWGLDVKKIVYAALGAALYGGLSIATNALQLPGAGNVSFRPAIVIPLLFAALFGPWVGFFAGGVGNLLGDWLSGSGVWWNWDLGNGLIGLITGLVVYYTLGRYLKRKNIIFAEVFAILGIVVGIGFASITDIWVSKLSFSAAVIGDFIPSAASDLINGLILLPILLIAYTAAVRRSGR